jgi:ferredoxin-NADP reductase
MSAGELAKVKFHVELDVKCGLEHPVKSKMSATKVVMIFAGTGVTPMLLLSDYFSSTRPASEWPSQGFHLIGCHSTWADATFYQDHLASRREVIKSHVPLTEFYFLDQGESPMPFHHGKLSSSELLRKAVGVDDFTGMQFFLCGPTTFCQNVEQYLVSMPSVDKFKIYIY